MYNYTPGKTGFGIGVENFALEQPTTLPIDSIYSVRNNVRGDLSPHAPGYIKGSQNFVPVSLQGNGVYFSGAVALQALVEFEKAVQNGS